MVKRAHNAEKIMVRCFHLTPGRRGKVTYHRPTPVWGMQVGKILGGFFRVGITPRSKKKCPVGGGAASNCGKRAEAGRSGNNRSILAV